MRNWAFGASAILVAVLAFAGTAAPARAQGLAPERADPRHPGRVDLGVAGFSAFRIEYLGAPAPAAFAAAPPTGLAASLSALFGAPSGGGSTFVAPAGAPSVHLDWNRNLGVSVADSARPQGAGEPDAARSAGLGAAVNVGGGVALGGHWRTSSLRAVESGPAGRQNVVGVGAAYDVGAFEFGATWDRVITEQLRAGWSDGPGAPASRWNLGVNYGVAAGKRLTLDYGRGQSRDGGDGAGADNAKSLDARLLWQLNPGFQLNVGYQNFRYTLGGGKPTEQLKITNTLQVQTRVNF